MSPVVGIRLSRCATLPFLTTLACAVDARGGVVGLESRKPPFRGGGKKLTVGYLAYSATRGAEEMEMIATCQFVERPGGIEEETLQYSDLAEDVDRVVDGGPTHVVPLFVKGGVKKVYIEVGLQAACHSEDREPLGSLPQSV